MILFEVVKKFLRNFIFDCNELVVAHKKVTNINTFVDCSGSNFEGKHSSECATI